MAGTQARRPTYKASLSRSQGREGWSIIFRHPVRQDEATGKPGKRVRRGLGTRDEAEAGRLVDQMNSILADQTYWDVAARSAAEQRFDQRIVDTFYHQMVPEKTDFSAVRESYLPLPSSLDSDYRRVLLLGTTGAGKTTLVRQIIGTDPVKERFPSVSTAKTTVADTELVLCDGSYRAIVTFVSRDEVREYLEECISAAVLAAYRKASDAEILRRLLTHVNQRFRFNYVLGNGPAFGVDDLEDEEEDLEEDEDESVTPAELGQIDLRATNELLERTIDQLREIAHRHGEDLRAYLEASEESDEQTLDEIFEEQLDELLREDEAFHSVADRLMDEIEQRFDMLDVGEVQRTRQGWPLSWRWETEDRAAFIKEVLRFSSNFAPLFGRLLAPLVNGVRVAGPFAPSWSFGPRPDLVLIDGEGLGHTPESSAGVSTKVIKQLDEVDAVLLVDNATQPMQAAPVAAMQAIVSSGSVSKLLVCFTHFDAVKGDNLPSASAKEEHVLASAENVLTGIGEELGAFAERALRRRLQEGRFFVGGIQERLKPSTKKRTIFQLSSLLNAIDGIVERPEPVEARPVYDRMNLVLAVRAAAENFHDAWLPRLGLKVKAGVPKEHWARVKALTRRLATRWQDEYDTLRPVADLYKQLQSRIYAQVQNPLDWEGFEPDEAEQQQVFDTFADEVHRRLLQLAARRLWDEHIQDWQEAYNQHGRGSTFVRAEIIAGDVYGKAAPVPEVVPSPDRNRFLHEVIEAVEEAAREVGVVLR